MNRPTILNYELVKDKFESKYNYELYTKELEAYCDELENAMDKACWCIVNNIDFLSSTKKTEEGWKEWFKEKWY